MRTITGSTGVTVSFSVAGSGPPLVLVHGGFSDHETNWSFVAPLLRERFTVYAIARRGRGATDATSGHTLEDEAQDVADVVRSIADPVYLLGHSYGLTARSWPPPASPTGCASWCSTRRRGRPR